MKKAKLFEEKDLFLNVPFVAKIEFKTSENVFFKIRWAMEVEVVDLWMQLLPLEDDLFTQASRVFHMTSVV